MGRTLHITNGDGAANIIKASAVTGDVLPWRDPMHHGPFPAGLDLEATSKVRAKYLAGGKIDGRETTGEFAIRDAHLMGSANYDEVVLWFEHDLLDQLQILQLLDWFACAGRAISSLTMICIDRFEGVEQFRGIGQLNRDQMASLFATRLPVTDRQLNLARMVWADFRASDPRSLESFARSGEDTLAFLRAALRRHFEEYPWVKDGLTRTERQILTLLANGESKPGQLFVKNMDYETVLFIGDWPTYTHILRLSSGPGSLIACESGAAFLHPEEVDISLEDFRAQRLILTELGQQVLDGQKHADNFIKRDFWLGGVHLQSGKNIWSWDDARERLVQQNTSA